MAALHQHVVRDISQSSLTPMTINLLIALVVLFAVVALLIGTLLILRQIRRNRRDQQDTLPMYTEKSSARSSRLTISTKEYSMHEKQSLMDGNSSLNDVPEIRITFPDDVDETGKRTSGRVVVVKVGDHSVGLEPVHEQLPPYEKSGGARFESLDLDRMGGLKEKDMR